MIKLSFDWRTFYLFTIVFRFVFALSNSYIHPDEHFQSFEVLTSRILGYSTNIPWEFQDSPARSLGPLYLLYAPLLYFIKFFNVNLTPLQIWYLARLQLAVLSWIATDTCLYWMLPTKPERIKAIFLTLTSYVTLVYQNHLFSNSVETLLLVVTVTLIDDLRYVQESKEKEVIELDKSASLFYIGVLVSIGIFNRVTFPAFLILPSWFLAKYALSHLRSSLYLILGFLLSTVSLILFDTYMFGNVDAVLSDPTTISNYTITPLNNLLYNTNYVNLSQHGIHPYYTHILINLPQILGPGLLFFTSTFYHRTTPFISVLSGLIFLSLVPHQELRFLVPIIPLACSCFDFTLKWIRPWMLYLWYVFNLAMCVLMGVFHQGGVIPALDFLRQQDQESVQVWWRTYSPPSWILGSNSTETIGVDAVVDDAKSINIVDCMGTDVENVQKVLDRKHSKPVYLITPVASFHHFNASQFRPVWNYTFHLDMDHIDFANFKPGIGIYELL
ncbi:GPI mannosyltransferase 4 [Candida viswanathii]|uniref:Mannosyltransferase n=1 Tax=Candida viswanathii TaxID=5486 RepID=A0A367XPU8_9ASCO|nr:GPI mannosyltransferase 4 [Candida viswanathii]